MTEWVSVREALAYLGLADLGELEQLVIDRDMDAEVDTEGNLVGIDGRELREALFDLHEQAVGYRPDDPKAQDAEAKRAARREATARRARVARRAKMIERVKARTRFP